MDIICPKGHHSTDLDYCSECGAKISDTPSAITTLTVDTTALPANSDVCPDCGTPRANPTAVFCEICRYNFATRQSWTAPDITLTPATKPIVVTPNIAPNSFVGWDAVLSVDGSLYTEPDPNVPLPNEPERTYPLDLAENLIGRRSDRRDIHPEINVNDAGVSHRHAKLLREPDGTLVLLEVGSTNGTRLNGVNVEAGIRTPVTDGDQITLGYWTRLVIRGKRS